MNAKEKHCPDGQVNLYHRGASLSVIIRICQMANMAMPEHMMAFDAGFVGSGTGLKEFFENM